MTYKALGDQDKALDAFRKAVQVKTDYSVGWQQIGRIQAAKGDKKQAVESFNKAIQYDPSNTDAMTELAVVYSTSGDFKSAEGLFQRALGVRDDATTNYNMATVKIELGKPQDALKYAQRAAEQAPNSALYQYTLGLAYEKTGDIDAAISAYNQAINLDKKYADPRVNLGKIYNNSGFPDKALAILEEAYKADPKSLEANNNLADTYNKKGLYDKAIFHWEISLNLAPRNTIVRMNLAKAYVSANRLDAAKDAYSALIKLDKTQWDAYLELGTLMASTGDSAGAKKILSDLIAQNPSYPRRAEAEKILSSL
jgi:tetratricopeptide (TPR) repeat protein